MKRFEGILALLILAIGGTSLGWTLEQSGLQGWQANTLTIGVNPTNCPISSDALYSIIDSAISTWNGIATANITLVRDSSVSTVTVAQFMAGTASPVPVILCDPNFATESGADPNGVPAATLPGTASPLVYGGMLLNAQSGTSAEISQLDAGTLTVVVAHEIGHLLGLGHSGDSQALMYFSVSGKTQAVITQDDRDGITYLYGREEFKNGVYGCGAVHRSDAKEASLPFLVTALMVLFFSWLARLGFLNFVRKPQT